MIMKKNITVMSNITPETTTKQQSYHEKKCIEKSKRYYKENEEMLRKRK